MSELRLVLRQTRWALLVILRVRETVMFTSLFPVVLLVFCCAIFSRAGATTESPGGGEPSASYFTTAMAAYAITFTAFSTLTISLVSQRESGQLKRLRGTPLPARAVRRRAGRARRHAGGGHRRGAAGVRALAVGVRLDAAALARIALCCR